MRFFCPRCRTEIIGEHQFCFNCGMNLSATIAMVKQRQAQQVTPAWVMYPQSVQPQVMPQQPMYQQPVQPQVMPQQPMYQQPVQPQNVPPQPIQPQVAEPQAEVTPVEEVPAEVLQVEEAPVEVITAEVPQVEETPVEVTPAEVPQVEEAPVEETKSEDLQGEETVEVVEEVPPAPEKAEKKSKKEKKDKEDKKDKKAKKKTKLDKKGRPKKKLPWIVRFLRAIIIIAAFLLFLWWSIGNVITLHIHSEDALKTLNSGSLELKGTENAYQRLPDYIKDMMDDTSFENEYGPITKAMLPYIEVERSKVNGFFGGSSIEYKITAPDLETWLLNLDESQLKDENDLLAKLEQYIPTAPRRTATVTIEYTRSGFFSTEWTGNYYTREFSDAICGGFNSAYNVLYEKAMNELMEELEL